MCDRWRRAGVCGILVLLAVLGGACSSNPPPGDDREPVIRDGKIVIFDDDEPAETQETPGRTKSGGQVEGSGGPDDDGGKSTAARYDIPPGHLPPPGRCRIWVPGEPPGQQKKEHRPGSCTELRRRVPAGAWLVYRPAKDRKHVEVWQYGDERRVLSRRLFEAATGSLIRYLDPPEG